MIKMRFKSIACFFISFIFFSSIMSQVKWPAAKAPVAEKKEHIRQIHGDTVMDNYYWMYDYFGKAPIVPLW